MAGRDLSRRTGWARHDELIRASAGLHFSIEKSRAWHIVRVPTRRIG